MADGDSPRQGKAAQGATDGLSAKGDFANFLKVLGARCELMHMTGTKDWRRHEIEASPSTEQCPSIPEDSNYAGLEALSVGNLGLGYEQSREIEATRLRSSTSTQGPKLPYAYFLSGSSGTTSSDVASAEDFESRLREVVYADGNMVQESQYDGRLLPFASMAEMFPCHDNYQELCIGHSMNYAAHVWGPPTILP